MCQSKTQQNFIMFIIVLWQNVSILTDSSSGPSKKIDPYLAMFKCWDPTALFETLLSKDLFS